jgi:large repetitive protein
LVDATAPTITSVNVPANGTYVSGQNLDFSINFDENITVNTAGGTPQLALTIGATTRQAVYQSGSGSSSLLYRYTVQSGDADNDGIAIGSLASNGATLRDGAGNNANLTLNSVGSTASVLVDATAPTVTSVTSSNADGSYKLGNVVVLQVSFNETVSVTGTPQLTLEAGITDRAVNYSSGSGTDTLVFNYTVQTGDVSSDLDYTAINALSLNGGSINDAAGNNASLTLPVPGTTGSLSANKTLVIDTAAPTAPTVPDLIAASDTGSSDSDNITDMTTPTFTGTAEANSTVNVLIDNISNGTSTADGSGNWSYTATVLAVGSHTVAATATDAAGNVSASSANLNIQIGFNAPAAPATVNATAGDAQASISFSAPANNGGTVITSYTVTSSPGGLTSSGAASPLTVTGLTNGVAYTFSVTATNSASTSAASAASNSVTPVAPNSAPTISGTPLTTVPQDTAYSFVPTAADVDADTTLTFSIVNKPSWAAFNTATGALTGTPGNSHVGVTSGIVISVSDGSLSAALPAFNLEVTNTNDVPTISGTPATTVAQDTAYSFVPTATDVDADTTLTFSIVNKPSWAAFNTATGALTGTPGNSDVGVTSGIVISVSDGSLSAALPAFNLEVTNTNDVPTISGTPLTTVPQDTAYSFVPTAADVDADTTLTFSIVNKPSWAAFNTATGALTGTPGNSDVGVTNAIVISVSDGSLSAALPAFNLEVTNTNDVPTISGTPATQVDMKTLYSFTPVAEDKDNDTLSFSISNKPGWAEFDAVSGKLSGTPQRADVGSTDNIVITVSDGELTASLADFNLQVLSINEAPTAHDDEISMVLNSAGLYLLDVLVNDTDPDADALTIAAAKASIGTVQIVQGKLQYQAPDNFTGVVTLSYSISDGEFTDFADVALQINGVNPDAPVITPPADLQVNATGLFTKVAVGVATAIDASGKRLAVTLQNGSPVFAPGKHELYWQATDSNGNSSTATQLLQVVPQVSLSKAKTVTNHASTSFDIMLNGKAAQYPLTVEYTVSGTASSAEHDLVSGTVVITDGTRTSVSFNLFADLTTETSKTIVVTLAGDLNSGANSSTTFTVTNKNLAPQVTLEARQQGSSRLTFAQNEGNVIVSATATDANPGDLLSLQWQADGALQNLSAQANRFEFDPATVATGVYKLAVIARDDGVPALSTTAELYLEVRNSLPVLTAADSNNNLIPDNIEGYGDANGNGIPDYIDPGLACNAIPEQISSTATFVAEGEPGICLRKGAAAVLGNSGGIELTAADQLWLEQDMQAQHVGGIFDFIMLELPTPGASFNIVLPQNQPLPDAAVYRKYNAAQGWTNFVSNDRNRLFSSAGERGYCPPPGDSNWQAGLTAGHWCVQLQIEDGGPNDADNIANGSIVDPGGVAVLLSGNTMPQAATDSYQLQWNQSHLLAVLQNDSDADGDALFINQASAAFGSVSISDDATSLWYTPAADFIGPDTLTYSVADGNGGSASAQVTLVVYFNRPPQVTQVSASTDDRTAININALANASDADGDTLTISAASAAQGNVSIVDNTMLRYVPNAGFDGTDTIIFTVSDGRGGLTQGQVLVTVNAYEVITVVNKSSGGAVSGWPLALLLLLVGMRQRSVAVVALMLLAITTSFSARANWSVESLYGRSQAKLSANAINAQLPAGTDVLQYDDRGRSWALGLNYHFTPRLAVQAQYVDLGESSLTLRADTLTPAAFYQAVQKIGPMQAEGIRSGLAYQFWQQNNWSAGVHAGVFIWKSDSTSAAGDTAVRYQADDTDAYWGLSASYALDQHVALKTGFSRYQLDGNKVDNLLVGISLAF